VRQTAPAPAPAAFARHFAICAPFEKFQNSSAQQHTKPRYQRHLRAAITLPIARARPNAAKARQKHHFCTKFGKYLVKI